MKICGYTARFAIDFAYMGLQVWGGVLGSNGGVFGFCTTHTSHSKRLRTVPSSPVIVARLKSIGCPHIGHRGQGLYMRAVRSSSRIARGDKQRGVLRHVFLRPKENPQAEKWFPFYVIRHNRGELRRALT